MSGFDEKKFNEDWDKSVNGWKPPSGGSVIPLVILAAMALVAIYVIFH